jgi:four helix bundle protein
VGVEKFVDLEAWQFSHQAVLEIYRFTEFYPAREMYALTRQLRRAAVSIPANIAEGFGRRKRWDKVKFYNISQASLEEVRYYLILSRDLAYVKETVRADQLLDRAAAKLKNLIRSILPKTPDFTVEGPYAPDA